MSNSDGSEWDQDRVLALFEALSNHRRWGDDDQRGTLNFMTDATRLAAAAEVRLGRSISISREIDVVGGDGRRPAARHRMQYYGVDPISCGDSLDIDIHGMATTHLDALGHESFEGRIYNGRESGREVLPAGLQWSNILSQEAGIFGRGVLLDICAVRGSEWLDPGERITDQDLNRAETAASTSVRSGDVVLVHSGFDRALAAGATGGGPERAGLGPECLPWLHQREVAVFAGDCIEQLPSPYPRVPFPLHQVGLAAMGLVLLDSVRLDKLVDFCTEQNRYTFLLTAAPLLIPGGTGSPVNPICTF